MIRGWDMGRVVAPDWQTVTRGKTKEKTGWRLCVLRCSSSIGRLWVVGQPGMEQLDAARRL